jgi:hypothetical protein
MVPVELPAVAFTRMALTGNPNDTSALVDRAAASELNQVALLEMKALEPASSEHSILNVTADELTAALTDTENGLTSSGNAVGNPLVLERPVSVWRLGLLGITCS